MALTPLLGWPVPDEYEDPHIVSVNATWNAIESSVVSSSQHDVIVVSTIGTISTPGELRGTRGSTGGVAIAKGFWVDGDDGGGPWRWIIDPSPPPDDGITTVVPGGTPGGYWGRILDGGNYNVRWAGARSAEVDNAPYISALISVIGADQSYIRFPAERGATPTVYAVDSDLVIPPNITLIVEDGARLAPGSGRTLIINGRVIASPVQIFDGTGTVSFASGSGWTNWWPRINTAVNSGLRHLRTMDGQYYEVETINVPSYVRWVGELGTYTADKGVVIQPTAAVSIGIKTYATIDTVVKNITVVMDDMSDAVTYGPADTISFVGTVDGGTVSDSAGGLGGFAEGQVLGVSGSSSNDGTYHIISATATDIIVKGTPLTSDVAGVPITLTAGAIGIRLQGLRRTIWENVRSIMTIGQHGRECWYLTPRDSGGFASYYNKFVGCDAKTGGSQKYGVGVGMCGIGLGTVTMNTWDTCRIQACWIDWLLTGTSSGVMLLNCNGESASYLGIYVSDTPAAKTTAPKVLGGEWHSADAGEAEALLMWNTTVNNPPGVNVLWHYYSETYNHYVRGDFWVGKEALAIVSDGGTLVPTAEHTRIEGSAGPVKLLVSQPIADGVRGQRLELIGNDNAKIVTIESGGNVLLRQGIWYGRINTTLTLYWSATADLWIEDSRTDPSIVYRTINNAFFRLRQEETELSLTGSSVTWASIIPLGVEVIGVTTHVTETITGSGVTGYQVGENSDADHWGAITGLAIGVESKMEDFTDRSRYITVNIRDIIITAVGGTFTGGKIRVTVFFQDLGPASS